MTNLEGRIVHLEIMLNNVLTALNSLQARVAATETNPRNIYIGGGGGGSGGGSVYYISPVAIAAGGNVTGQTVKYLVGGTATTFTTTGTIYNVMASATSGTLTSPIIVIPNGDGTFLAVSQGCT